MSRFILSALLLCSSVAHAIDAESVNFKALAKQCAPGVHIDTLSAIVQHESRVNPFAIGINTKGVRLPSKPINKEEAVAAANWLKSNNHNFDGGLGQINSANLEWLGMSIDDLFDPCKNLAGSAKVITECYKRAAPRYSDQQAALQAALSCYNTGNFNDGFTNGYVLNVASNANMDVPALLPVSKTSSTPFVLQGSINKPLSSNAVKPLPDGIGDAFSKPSSDAFTVPQVDADQKVNVDANKD